MLKEDFQKIMNDFDITYKTQILPRIEPYEQQRQKLKTPIFILIITGIALVLGVMCIFMFGINFPNEEMQNIICAISSISGIIFIKLGIHLNNKFKNSLKSEILPILFYPFGYFETKTKNKNNIISEKPLGIKDLKRLGYCRQYSTARKIDDDIIKGYYNNKPLFITETKMVHYESNGRSIYPVTDFKGLIIQTVLDKNYRCTVVLSHKDGIPYNNCGGLEKVNLEDSEFEELYRTFSDSQIESRYFLELNFMEKIKQAKEILNANSIDLYLKENILYIFIACEHNFFEIFTYLKGIYDEQEMKGTFWEIISIFKLIDYLNR